MVISCAICRYVSEHLCWQYMQANMWLYDFHFVLLSFMKWTKWWRRPLHARWRISNTVGKQMAGFYELPFCFWSSLLWHLLVTSFICGVASSKCNRLHTKYHNAQNLIFPIRKCTKSMLSFSIREGISVAIFSGAAIHLPYTHLWPSHAPLCSKATFCIDQTYDAREICNL